MPLRIEKSLMAAYWCVCRFFTHKRGLGLRQM
jgi:hypothetical protein